MDHHSWRPSSRWGARSSSGELEPQGSSSAPPWDATGHGDGRGGEFRSHPRPPSRAYLRPPLASRRRGRGPGLAMAGEGIGECSVLLLGGAPRPPSCSGGALSPASPGDSAVRRAGGRRRLVPASAGRPLDLPARPPPRVLLPRAPRPSSRGRDAAADAGQLVLPLRPALPSGGSPTRRSWSRRPGRRGRVRASESAPLSPPLPRRCRRRCFVGLLLAAAAEMSGWRMFEITLRRVWLWLAARRGRRLVPRITAPRPTAAANRDRGQ